MVSQLPARFSVIHSACTQTQLGVRTRLVEKAVNLSTAIHELRGHIRCRTPLTGHRFLPETLTLMLSAPTPYFCIRDAPEQRRGRSNSMSSRWPFFFSKQREQPQTAFGVPTTWGSGWQTVPPPGAMRALSHLFYTKEKRCVSALREDMLPPDARPTCRAPSSRIVSCMGPCASSLCQQNPPSDDWHNLGISEPHDVRTFGRVFETRVHSIACLSA